MHFINITAFKLRFLYALHGFIVAFCGVRSDIECVTVPAALRKTPLKCQNESAMEALCFRKVLQLLFL